MNHRMWLHPATQANIATLRARGVQVIGPDDGPLAEGESGPGPHGRTCAIVAALGRQGHEDGMSTQYIAGRPAHRRQCRPDLRGHGSGPVHRQPQQRQDGFRDRPAAARRGAQVVLVAGPVSLPTPEGVQRLDVRSAAQMHEAVLAQLPADVYVGAAAVADLTPARPPAQDQEDRRARRR